MQNDNENVQKFLQQKTGEKSHDMREWGKNPIIGVDGRNPIVGENGGKSY